MPGSSRWSEFRERGGLWVAAQFALMADIAAAWLLPPEYKAYRDRTPRRFLPGIY
jgi:hypothetical protein